MFAPFIALFGDRIFWILPIVWDIAMLLGLFLTVRHFFAPRLSGKAWIAALIAVAAYGTIINFRLNLRRDIACEALLSAATLFVMLAMAKKKAIWWHGASGMLCFISIIKLNLAMMFLPFGMILLYERPWKGMSMQLVVRHAIVGAAVASVFFAPFFIENHVSSGHWYMPVQGVSIETDAAGYAKGNLAFRAAKSFVLTCQDQGYIYSPKGLPAWVALIFVAIALLGMWAQRRHPFVRFWAFPCLALLYMFYTVWNITWRDFAYTTNIYLAPAYPLMVFFFVCGLYSIGGSLFKREAIAWTAAAVFLIPFFAVKVYYSIPATRHERFQLSEVAGLRDDLLAHIPAGSVLLCDRFLNYNIDYFTPIYSFPPAWLDDSSSTIIDKVGYLLDKGIPVFFCDYRGIEGSYTYQSRLESAFSLERVKQNQELHKYPSEFPAPPFSIYSIRHAEYTHAKQGNP